MLRNGRRSRRDRGGAMIEFAISLSLFFTMFFGVVNVGRALYAYNWVSNAARKGTRFALVRGTNCVSLQGGCPAQASDVTNYVKTFAQAIDPSKLTVTTECYASAGATAKAPPCAPGGYVQVQVQYTFSFVSSLFPLSWTMHSSSERIVQN